MCAILFTSGTTGTSKGVMLNQRALTAAVNVHNGHDACRGVGSDGGYAHLLAGFQPVAL